MRTCLVVLALSLPATLHAQDAPVRDVDVRARIVATAGVAGRFTEARCSASEALVPHEAAGFTGPLSARGGAGALVLDTGGLLAPHGVTRFANRDFPADVAELVHALGYQVLAFGENDLGAPRPRTLLVAHALAERGIPYVATNLRCAPDQPLCDGIVDARDAIEPLRVGEASVALLALLDPAVLERVAPDRSAGLTLEPIAERLPDAVRAARAAGAEVVVAVLDVGSAEAFTLARGLPDDARPDLVLLADAGDDLLFAQPPSLAPAIVAPPPGSGVEISVGRSAALASAFEMLAQPLSVMAPASVASPVTEFADAVGAAYCAAWGRGLPGGALARPIDAADVATLAAQIVREHADADAAFLNVQAVASSFRPADPARLSASDFYIALEYDEPLVVADVPASWLREALDRAGAHGLVTPGLTSTGAGLADLRIRHRAPVPAVSYRVVTIRFLAEGGDGALPPLPEGTTWRTLEHEENGETRYDSLRDVVLAGLERPSERDPRDVRPSPDDAPEWIVGATLDGTFAGSTLDNPQGYDAALLAVRSSIAMGLAIELRASASAPDWTWENRLTGSFRTQWAPSSEPGTPGAFAEAQDQIQLRSLGSWRGWRTDPTAVYVPDLFVEAFVESELTRPAARDFHWLLIRPTVGLRFPLASVLDVRLSGGLEAQVLRPGAEAEPGAGASIVLSPWTIFGDGARSLTAAGSADFFAADLFDQNRWQLRGSLDLALDLAGPFALTLGSRLYVQEESARGAAVAFSATAGVRLATTHRVVGP